MPDGLTAFRAYLESRGLKVTNPRLKIAETIFGQGGHFSADELADRVRAKNPRIGRVTVYRTLTLLAESGLLGRLDVGQGRAYYEPLHGVRRHDHLVCVQCGAIAEFRNDGIERMQDDVARRNGFTLTSQALKLYGYCAQCRPSLTPRPSALPARMPFAPPGTRPREERPTPERGARPGSPSSRTKPAADWPRRPFRF
ncbi:MAG: transcriptional repressor [Planctomycetes bacterium]|nr:transcriptional repressor [Planctomycetota bacterium]